MDHRENDMRDFRKFDVTRLARSLTVEIYALLSVLPADERFALGQQLRRAAVSVGANIAEGAGRTTAKDFAHFLSQSIGSLCELEYLLLVALDLGYINSASQNRLDRSIQFLKQKLFRFKEAVLKNSEKRTAT
jgi:four helix bundle protein